MDGTLLDRHQFHIRTERHPTAQWPIVPDDGCCEFAGTKLKGHLFPRKIFVRCEWAKSKKNFNERNYLIATRHGVDLKHIILKEDDKFEQCESGNNGGNECASSKIGNFVSKKKYVQKKVSFRQFARFCIVFLTLYEKFFLGGNFDYEILFSIWFRKF